MARRVAHQCLVSLTVFMLLLPTVFRFTPEVESASTTATTRRINPEQLEEWCKNFTHGNSQGMEFYSPMYPGNYPSDITCFRTITADPGYFVRIDFRDVFLIEPPSSTGKCEYDYLEIRDGDQGYSPLIGKYCGNQFPPIITSSGRSLWLRFSSDSTIQYMGFKAVYTLIPNTLGQVPDIGRCSFPNETGHQGFIGHANISDERREHSVTYDTPIDCVWTITAEKGFTIYLQFETYKLEHPNDCHLNYIQIFDGKTDNEHLKKSFCGSVAESVTSETNQVFIRFYAEKKGANSEFNVIFTAMRQLQNPGELPESDVCDPETEYDCDDATCIHPDLVCNKIRNCKFGWDEESCVAPGSDISLDFTSPHVLIILIILIIILLGMGGGMVWSFRKVLEEDRQELEEAAAAAAAAEEEAAAKKSVNSVNRTAAGNGIHESITHHKRPPLALPQSSEYNSGASESAGAGGGGGGAGANGESCYVPDGGFPYVPPRTTHF